MPSSDLRVLNKGRFVSPFVEYNERDIACCARIHLHTEKVKCWQPSISYQDNNDSFPDYVAATSNIPWRAIPRYWQTFKELRLYRH